MRSPLEHARLPTARYSRTTQLSILAFTLDRILETSTPATGTATGTHAKVGVPYPILGYIPGAQPFRSSFRPDAKLASSSCPSWDIHRASPPVPPPALRLRSPRGCLLRGILASMDTHWHWMLKEGWSYQRETTVSLISSNIPYDGTSFESAGGIDPTELP